MPELETPTAASSGTQSLMADFVDLSDVGSPPPETPPVVTPPPDAKAPPAAKTPPTTSPKADPKAPDAKVTPPVKAPKADANAELRKQYDQTKSELETYKTKSVPELEKKLKELESKVPTEDTAKKIEAAEKRINELQGRLTQVDYAQSDEFKNAYVKPWEQTLANTMETVKQLTVSVGTDGQQRAATQDDFWAVANAPLSQRGRIATELFGPNAVTIIGAINQLQDFKSRADQAITSHAQQNEVRQREANERTTKERQSYEQTHQAATKELETTYPQFFGEDANDPEAKTTFQKGLAKVDEWMQQPGATPEERAQKAAVVRAWAGSFPRNVRTIEKQASEITSLKAELAKLRGSDPGAGDEGGKPAGEKDTGLTGTKKMIAEFD